MNALQTHGVLPEEPYELHHLQIFTSDKSRPVYLFIFTNTTDSFSIAVLKSRCLHIDLVAAHGTQGRQRGCGGEVQLLGRKESMHAILDRSKCRRSISVRLRNAGERLRAVSVLLGFRHNRSKAGDACMMARFMTRNTAKAQQEVAGKLVEVAKKALKFREADEVDGVVEASTDFQGQERRIGSVYL